MELKIYNVSHDEFEGVNFIRLQYDYKDMFGTLNIDDCADGEFKIDEIHMGYTLYNDNFKYVINYLNMIIKGKKLEEVLKSLREI